MTVTRVEVPFGEFIRLPGRARRWRWRTGNAAGSQAAHVTVGWLPDGRWFVEDTRAQVVWLHAGDDPVEVRDAALDYAETLRDGGDWPETIATYQPGVAPARAATVPDWPPGHGPG